jgi:hypothetical protein
MGVKSLLGFQTEVDFELPRGYVDSVGVLHRRGVMRLATAGDEITPLRDPRVQQNPAYLSIIVLSRVITRLGTLTDLDVRIIEGLFASDLDYLQRLYERINTAEEVDPVSTALGRANGMAHMGADGSGPRAVGEG